MKTIVLTIGEAGLAIARTIASELPEAELVSTCALPGCRQVASLSSGVAEAFADGKALIFIGAMGICVRTIGPFLRSKHTDPAVVCVDTTGRYAISVVSGHIGGANRLTQTVAHILGAEPVITTQSDRTGQWALDLLPERFGWSPYVSLPTSEPMPVREVPNGMNPHIALFVAGRPTALLLELRDRGTDWLEAHLPAHVSIYHRLTDVDLPAIDLLIVVGPRTLGPLPVPALVYLPRCLHLGIGLARQAGPTDEVLAHIFGVLAHHGVRPESVASVSTITLKADEPVIRRLEAHYPIHLYTAEQLAEVSVPNPSPTVLRHVNTPSVCEASAILSAGGGELIVPKQKGSNYTVAVALAIDMQRRGHIEIVGAGPGDPELISLRGRSFLERADLILYAGSLVPRELTACAKPGAVVRSSAGMNLEEQFALMKEHYDRGALIVRLHTGDPCIYGAIEEQMNYFDQHGMSYHITPGISSFQAAASALRSQFTIPERVQTIILTRGEGRTPMPEREKLHLLARSRSTLCIFLSAGIADRVQDELLQEYPPTTPVAVCYHLTWPDERIFRGQLADLARLVNDNGLTLTTLLVVGDAIDNRQGLSRLYSAEFAHKYRNNEPRTANNE